LRAVDGGASPSGSIGSSVTPWALPTRSRIAAIFRAATSPSVYSWTVRAHHTSIDGSPPAAAGLSCGAPSALERMSLPSRSSRRPTDGRFDDDRIVPSVVTSASSSKERATASSGTWWRSASCAPVSCCKTARSPLARS
jgi:hypothetical protein